MPKIPEMADSPIANKLGIQRRLGTFQVMCRTVGTNLQKHGTMKDPQQVSKHANMSGGANLANMRLLERKRENV